MRGRLLVAGLWLLACGHARVDVRAPTSLISIEDGGAPGTPCARARERRDRAAAWAAEGRLDRAARALDRAGALCPAQAARTYGAKLSILLELGRDEEARTLCQKMETIVELSEQARLARLALRPRVDDRVRARSLTLEALAAGVRGEHARARDRFIAAFDAAPSDGEPLIGAGLSSLKLGELVAARRYFDRAAVALERAAGEARVVELGNGPTAPLRAARFSPKGDAIAIAHGDSVSVYAGPSLKLARSLRGHNDLVGAVAFSPDGTRLATASRDKTVRVWDLASGRVVATLAHGGAVAAVAWSADGKLATASYDRRARVYAPDFKLTLELHAALALTAISFAPDGRTIATGGLDRVVRIVDATTGTVRRSFPTVAGVTSLAHAPNGRHLAIGTTDARVFVFDLDTGWHVATLEGHAEHITDVSFSPDGTALGTASADATIRIWEPGVGYVCRKTLEGHVARATAVAFAPHATIVATASEDRALLLWDSHSGAHLGMIGAHADPVTSVAVSRDKTIASGSRDAIVRLIRNGAVTALSGHVAAVGALAFTPDGHVLVSGADDNTLRTWDVASSKARDVIRGHKAAISSLAISPDGSLLASGSRDGVLRVLDGKTWSLVAKRRHAPAIESVAFSPDGTLLASGGVDGTIEVGPPLSLPKITFRHWSEPILALSFLDDMRVVSASLDGSVGTFSVLDGTRLAVDEGHHDAATGITIVGSDVVSSSADGTVRWAGRSITANPEGALAIAALDAERVVTGGEDGALRVLAKKGTFLVGVRAMRRSGDAWSFTADGYFDARGEARGVATCRIGAVHHPIELCEERYAVDDLFARVLRGDESFRDQ